METTAYETRVFVGVGRVPKSGQVCLYKRYSCAFSFASYRRSSHSWFPDPVLSFILFQELNQTIDSSHRLIQL